MSNTNELNSTNNVINVIVIIDTDRIINDPNIHSVSKDPAHPTQIGHQYSYMVAPNQSVKSGEGTGDLNIQANRDDVIRWTGLSESCNSDSSVLIYGLPRYAGNTVFTGVEFVNSGRLEVEPQETNHTSPLPVKLTEQKHWYAQATINELGTENYQVQFALYYRPHGGNQELYGYFQWDPTITVTN
ncbi:inclusion body family protein [Pectobacterium brasiliense]|uniref:inclusion body family protein n=1 Tax=Pectobacterium brasiliense TaxID=180957 RepID=UPI001969A9FA|nr:inclusion body family protein [Pectobacterium brasiliense]MBN3341821.1 inclusion body family protein [Pectobacterium brasiliense]